MRDVKPDRTLTRAEISAAITEAHDLLVSLGADHRSAVKAQFELEEYLLEYIGRFGESVRFGVAVTRRFGRIGLTCTAEAFPFDPLEETGAGSFLLKHLVALEDVSPKWAWRNGLNVIEIPVERAKAPVSLVKMVAVSLGLAVAAGLLAGLLPPGIAPKLVQGADAAFGLLLDVIKGVAGPFIFVMIVCSICAVGDVKAFGRAGVRLALGAAACFGVAVIAGVGMARLFTTPGTVGAAAGGLDALAPLVTRFVPTNLFVPFIESNIPQILILAIVSGLILQAFGGQMATLVRAVEELKTFLGIIMNAVLRYLLPPMVFFCVFAIVADRRLALLASCWKVAVLTIGTVTGYTFLLFSATCARFRVSPGKLMADVWPAALIGLTTSSPVVGLAQEMQTLKRKFGVKAEFADFALPLILPISSFGYYTELAVMMVSMAGYYHLAMPLSWLVLVVLLVIIGGLSTPPFPGTAGIVMGVLCTQLGIPADCVGLLIAIDMAVDYTSCFGNAIIRLCLIRQVNGPAGSLGTKKE